MTISLEEQVARPTPGQAAFYEFWRHKNGVTRWEWENIDPAHKLFWNRIGAAAAESERAACEAIARGELWFPDENNGRYRCEVGNGQKADAGHWSDERDYGCARNAAADAIAARKGKGDGK